MGRCYSMGSNTIAVLQDKEAVMRLIDADPLIGEIAEIYGFSISSVKCSLTGCVIANAPTIETKQIKYFDEEEKVWKIGNVIIDSEEG